MDTSDRFVKRMQVKTLRGFLHLLQTRSNVDPSFVAGLKDVVAKYGTNSVEYDNYLKGIEAFRKGEQ